MAEQAAGQAATPSSASQSPTPAIDPSLEYILVLEDSAPNRKILERILQKLGYGVFAADDGEVGKEHLEIIKKQNLTLVAIISDLMMPKMDGLQFLTHVRTETQYKDVPFVFVTASSDKSNVIEAKKLRINGYLLKPVTMEKIVTKLKELFPTKLFKTW